MPKSLYLIDGHAQIFRAYFAPFGNLSSPTGEPTRATHVFCQVLLNILRDRKPDYLVMVMDTSDETVFRRDFYPDYKAHRDPAPEDLGPQIERIVSILEAVQVPILRVPRYEADDIIATLVKRLAGEDLEIFLVSKDKDLEQLLSERVALYDPGKDEVVTPRRLVELKGWPPELAIDAQTLIGDSVDNVPGVPGIGPKTAAKLLAKYGSVQGVIAHADELTPKQRENVRAFAPRAELTRRLVTLHDDVPFDFDLACARVERFQWSNAREIFESLGFRRLTDQLPATELPSGATPARVPAESASLAAARDTAGSTTPARTEATLFPAALDQRYACVDTVEALEDFCRRLAEQTEFAFDTETTGIAPIDAVLVGLSFSWEPGTGYYLPVRTVYGRALDPEIVRARLAPIFANPATRKVGQNLKYDLIVLREAGMPVAGPLFDTMVAAFLVDPLQRTFGLDKLALAYFGHKMIPITDLIGTGRQQLRMDQVPCAQVAEYAGEDADFTWRLKQYLEPRLAQGGVESLFRDTEMPLVSVLMEMEYQGVTIDVPLLQQMSVDMTARAKIIAQEVCDLAGCAFNPDSPRQVSEILFDKMGYRVVKRTKTARSTDAETLEILASETQDELPRKLLEYREIQKLLGTYIDALPKARSLKTGRVHTSFHQTGAITGRLSSSEPNLQNIPIRTDTGRQIRRAFIPRSPDERLIVADYSQVELRILAHFSGDEALIQAFAEDRDIHAFVAAQVNGVPIEEVTPGMRGRAKAVNFGIIYGQTAFGLARGTGMGRSEAQAFIDDYFRRYPRIRGFLDACIDEAKRDGEVRTVLGRRRPIPDIHSRNRALRSQAERLAVNTVVQGSAADLIKTAMIRLHARIEAENLPLRLLLQVHDELVCEAPRARAAEFAELISGTMSGAMQMRVPLKAEAHIGDNWLESK